MNCQVCTDYAKETDHVPKKSQKPRPKKETRVRAHGAGQGHGEAAAGGGRRTGQYTATSGGARDPDHMHNVPKGRPADMTREMR